MATWVVCRWIVCHAATSLAAAFTQQLHTHARSLIVRLTTTDICVAVHLLLGCFMITAFITATDYFEALFPVGG